MKRYINNCPECKAFRSIYLENSYLACSSCSFTFELLCLHCNVGKLERVDDQTLECKQCQVKTSFHTIQYILENKLKVDSVKRCEFCNGPTLLRNDLNIKHRCFDYPNCGNQIDLFGNTATQTNVFLDLETTGLEIGTESIIEIGACKVEPNGKESFFREFIRPVNVVSNLITKITGIDQEMVSDAPPLKPVLEEFIEFCGDANIIAHNAQFDIPWLICSLLRHDLPVPFKDVTCTLNWAKQNEEGRRSLGALSKKYQIGHENAHRALADAVVTKVLYYIYQQEKKSEPPVESVDRYIEISKKIMHQNPEFIQH